MLNGFVANGRGGSIGVEMEIGEGGLEGGRSWEMEGRVRRRLGNEKVQRRVLGRSWITGSGWFCCVGLVGEFGWGLRIGVMLDDALVLY